MHDEAAAKAAQLLFEARTGRRARLEALPADCAPQTIADAHRIQEVLAGLFNDTAGGMKVSASQGEVRHGLILASRILASPARWPRSPTGLCGVEAEIAFRLDRALPQREAPYSRQEVSEAVTALAAIEVVDTAFVLPATPPLHRAADFLVNGGLVTGTERPDWREIDLSGLEAVVTVNGVETKRQTGGLDAGDPLTPAVALVNDLAARGPVPAGFLVTTGSYTGLDFKEPGDVVTIEFVGFGTAEVTFEA